MKSKKWLTGAAFLLAAHALPALALELGPVEVHGFASQGFLLSSDNNYLAKTDDTGSFEFTEAGLNVSTELGDKLRFGLQLFARDLGDIGNNKITLDWAYVDYRHKDQIGVRLGKFKTPFGLYNEVRDYDMLRTSVLLPDGVYDMTWRETLVATQGGELYGNVALGRMGDVEYQAYVGSTNIEEGEGIAKLLEARANVVLDSATVRYLFGGNLRWNTPLQGLTLGASAMRANLEMVGAPNSTLRAQLAAVDAALAPIFPQFEVPSRLDIDINQIDLWVLSARQTLGPFTLAGEYARQRGHLNVLGIPQIPGPVIAAVQGVNPPLAARLAGLNDPDIERSTEGWYVQGSYRLNKWLELGAYYSVYYADRNDKDGSAGEAAGEPDHFAWQKDTAVSLRFDVNPHWLFKLEAHFIDGTAMLFPQDDPDGLAGLDRKWRLFAAKTSVSF